MTDNLARLFDRQTNDDRLSEPPAEQHHRAPLDILHLAELVPIIRDRLDIDDAFPDDAIFSAITAIARQTETRDRWQAAFTSNLGHWLALKRQDLNAALNTLISLLPPPRS